MIRVAVICHEHGKWVVRTEDRSRVLGTHDTREEAEKQLYAIEINKKHHKKSSVEWSTRYTREAGVVDHTLLSPCTGDKECTACMHFDELMEVPEKGSKDKPAKPLSAQQKKHNKKMQEMKRRHQETRRRLKSAAVTPGSLADFYQFVTDHNDAHGTSWRVQFYGAEPVGLGETNSTYKNLWRQEPLQHDIVVLHNPQNGNSIRLYDHSNFDKYTRRYYIDGGVSELKPARSEAWKVWNLIGHRNHIHDFMSILDRQETNTTLNLADTGTYPEHWDSKNLDSKPVGGYVWKERPSEVNLTHPLDPAIQDFDPRGIEHGKHYRIFPRNDLYHELAHKSINENPDKTISILQKIFQQGVLDPLLRGRVSQDPQQLTRRSNILRSIPQHLSRAEDSRNLGDICQSSRFSRYWAWLPLRTSSDFLRFRFRDKASQSSPYRRGRGNSLEPGSIWWHPWNYAVMATSVSDYGTTNLHEYVATHAERWKLGLNYNRASAVLAHYFGWGPSGNGQQPVRDASTIFDDPCNCHFCRPNPCPCWTCRKKSKK